MRNEFDLTICEDMKIDHGIYSWLPYVAAPPWPAPVLPLAVNMVRHPIPTSQRLRKLGDALRAAIESYPGDARVAVIATGGMSHQISGARFGIANEEWDRYLPQAHRERHRRAGRHSAGRDHADRRHRSVRTGDLVRDARRAVGQQSSRAYDFYTFPQITGCGVVVFDDLAA